MLLNSIQFAEPCLERHFAGHCGGITQVCFKPDACGSQVATSGEDSAVILWDLKQAARCIRFSAHCDEVTGVSWSPKSNLVASASKDRTVKIWEPKLRGGVSGEFLAHGKVVRSVDFDPTGTMIVTASDDKSLKLWKVAHRKFLISFNSHTNWVRSAKFSPNGQLIASCGDDKSLRIFDVNSGQCVRTFTEERGMGRRLAWHPDGRMVAVALSCNRVKIFDIAENQLIQLYQVHAGPVNDVAFHPSGNFLLTGSDDETMKILDLLEGRPIYTLTGHTDKVTTVAFSKDGKAFASAGSDRQLLIWKSNLHTYEASLFQAKQNSTSNAQADNGESAGSSCDQSIIIDARRTDAFQACDENFQVLNGEYTNYKPTPHETPKSSSTDSTKSSDSLLHLPSSSDNFSTHNRSKYF